MRRSSIMLLFAIGIGFTSFFVSCSESKEDIRSREELSSMIRQLNLLSEDFLASQNEEDALTISSIEAYYGRLTPPLKERRMKLAAMNLSPKYAAARFYIDQILAHWMACIDLRKEMNLSMFSLYNARDDQKAGDLVVQDKSRLQSSGAASVDSSSYEFYMDIFSGQLGTIRACSDSLNRIMREHSPVDRMSPQFALKDKSIENPSQPDLQLKRNYAIVNPWFPHHQWIYFLKHREQWSR